MCTGSHQLLTFLKIGTRALKKAPLGLSLRHFVPPCCSNPAAEIEKDRHTNVYRSFSVGAAGFEPTASSSRTRRATNCAMPRKYRNPMGCGLVGDERIELPQVESESTALPLCKSPLFGFALSTEALLTRNIIQPPPPFVNHFFDFSVHAINQSTSATKICMIFYVFSHSTNRPLGFLSLQSIKIVQFYQRVCSRPALLAFSPLFI